MKILITTVLLLASLVMFADDGIISVISGTTTKGGTASASAVNTGTLTITNNWNGILATNLYATNMNISFGAAGVTNANGSVTVTASGGTQVYSNQTVTIAGTANQITSSAGAQDLTANRTWTLSLPDPLVAPGVITGNGSGITNILGTFYRSSTVVNNTGNSSASNVVSFSIPANALGTNYACRIYIAGDILQNSGTSTNLTMTFKYGTTTLWAETALATASANRRVFSFDLELSAQNSTSSQLLSGFGSVGTLLNSTANPTTGEGTITGTSGNQKNNSILGTSAEDSTGALNFQLVTTWASAATTCEFKVQRVDASIR